MATLFFWGCSDPFTKNNFFLDNRHTTAVSAAVRNKTIWPSLLLLPLWNSNKKNKHKQQSSINKCICVSLPDFVEAVQFTHIRREVWENMKIWARCVFASRVWKWVLRPKSPSFLLPRHCLWHDRSAKFHDFPLSLLRRINPLKTHDVVLKKTLE